jgi:hypothetical protein
MDYFSTDIPSTLANTVIKLPKHTVVSTTSIRVFWRMTLLCSGSDTSSIFTRYVKAKAMAPLIRPPYQMKIYNFHSNQRCGATSLSRSIGIPTLKSLATKVTPISMNVKERLNWSFLIENTANPR